MFKLITVVILGVIAYSYGNPLSYESDNVAMDVAVPRGYTRDEYFKSIVDYWTPERMESAISLDVLTVKESDVPIIENTPREQKAASILAQSTLKPGMVHLKPRVAGKVYFSVSGSNYICSGSSVTAANKDTVITAGHCVYDYERQVWATNWVFVPDFSFGSRPSGTFTGRKLATKAQWMQSRDFNNDVGIVLMNTNERGQHLQDAVGGLGITLDAPRDGYVHAFGYPKNINNGEAVSNCPNRPLSPTFIAGFTGLQLPCNMTGGSSGGPWVQEHDVNNLKGQQVSVNSFIITSRPNNLFGPYFIESNIGSLYRENQNL